MLWTHRVLVRMAEVSPPSNLLRKRPGVSAGGQADGLAEGRGTRERPARPGRDQASKSVKIKCRVDVYRNQSSPRRFRAVARCWTETIQVDSSGTKSKRSQDLEGRATDSGNRT